MRKWILVCLIGALTGVSFGASEADLQKQVSVFLATDYDATHTALRHTTVVLVNRSTVPIYVPTTSFKNLFATSIVFECLLPNEEIKRVGLKYGDERFAPTFHQVAPGMAITKTLYWHEALETSFTACFAEAETVRVRWFFFLTDSQHLLEEISVVSEWIPKTAFNDPTWRTHKINRDSAFFALENPQKAPLLFKDEGLEIKINDEL